MKLLRKIQSQSERTRKIILWSIIAVLGLALLAWWGKSLGLRVKGFQSEEFIENLEIPKVEMPKLEIQEVNEELQKLKELLEAIEKNDQQSSETE